MRDRLRGRAGAMILLALLGVAAALLCAREAMRRSLYSVEVAGVVQFLEVRTEKHPGRDDRHYVTIDDVTTDDVTTDVGGRARTLEIDPAVASLLSEGATIRSAGHVLEIDGRPARVLFDEQTSLLGIALLAGLAFPAFLERFALAGLARRRQKT